jgi:hypothetical protein
MALNLFGQKQINRAAEKFPAATTPIVSDEVA